MVRQANIKLPLMLQVMDVVAIVLMVTTIMDAILEIVVAGQAEAVSTQAHPSKEAAIETSQKCQICKKIGHEASHCWYRYNEDNDQQIKVVGAATAGYGYDSNWYVDSGAIDHVTGELEKLSARDKYTGCDQVHTTNDTGMTISNIGYTILHTPDKDLFLKYVLHVPSTNKNIVSVHKLT